MSVSVKRFKLRKCMLNGEIADKLGVVHGYEALGVFSRPNGQWVGSRVNDEVFTLAINETELHQKAREFADEAGES